MPDKIRLLRIPAIKIALLTSVDAERSLSTYKVLFRPGVLWQQISRRRL